MLLAQGATPARYCWVDTPAASPFWDAAERDLLLRHAAGAAVHCCIDGVCPMPC
jgi:hypothetical protein